MRVIGSTLGFFFELMCLELIAISKAIIIIYNPFITTLISYALIKEKITKYDIGSFFLCTVGVVLLTNPFS